MMILYMKLAMSYSKYHCELEPHLEAPVCDFHLIVLKN